MHRTDIFFRRDTKRCQYGYDGMMNSYENSDQFLEKDDHDQPPLFTGDKKERLIIFHILVYETVNIQESWGMIADVKIW